MGRRLHAPTNMNVINMKTPRINPSTNLYNVTCMKSSLHTKRVRNEEKEILSNMWLTVELNEKMSNWITLTLWGTTIEHNKG